MSRLDLRWCHKCGCPSPNSDSSLEFYAEIFLVLSLLGSNTKQTTNATYTNTERERQTRRGRRGSCEVPPVVCVMGGKSDRKAKKSLGSGLCVCVFVFVFG